MTPLEGIAFPDLARAVMASPLFTTPSMLKSERKFVVSVVCPERLRTWMASPELTVPSPLESPRSGDNEAAGVGYT